MRPPEDEVRLLVGEWPERYLKALLTERQIEFPKTHVIKRLLILLEPVDPAMVKELDDAN